MMKHIILAIFVSIFSGIHLQAQTLTPTTTAPDEITSWLIADEIKVAQHGTLAEFTATGNVEIITPDMSLKASSFHGTYDSATSTVVDGEAQNIDANYKVYNPQMYKVPINFHLSAKNIEIRKGKNPFLQDADITTCKEKHPHYHLNIRSGEINETGSIRANKVSFYLGNTRLITLPYLKGSLFSKDEASAIPSISVGYNPDDGPLLQTKIRLPIIDESNTLQLAARMGTKGQFRGDVRLAHVFALPRNSGEGTLTLSVTRNEDITTGIPELNDIANTSLRKITLNREPALKFSISPLTLGNSPSSAYLNFGGSFGRYREEPAGITGTRMQAWGVIGTPTYNLGRVLAHADFGYQVAKYNGGEHHSVTATQLTIETDPSAPLAYGNLTYIQRNESGRTPYQFDRVQFPREVYSEVEIPVSRDRCTKLAVWNRFDIDSNRFRSINLTATYNLDCIAYGLTYDFASKNFGVGFKLNFLDTFRKGGTGRLSFAQ